PQQLGDVLERRLGHREVDRKLAAIRRPARRDRRDRRVEHRLAPAKRAGGDRAVTGSRVAPHAQPLEVVERIEARPAACAGDASNRAPADVGVERPQLDSEVFRRASRVDPTLIVDSTLINHTRSIISIREVTMSKATSSGLEGIVVAETAISDVDGELGKLVIAGADVEELAQRATFEDATARVLAAAGATIDPEALPRELARARETAWEVLPRLGDALDARDGMDALRASLAHLASTGDDLHDAFAVVGAAPVFVAAWSRRRRGLAPVAPNLALGHAADYLTMTVGEAPPP